jgi:hypothetical protein
MKSGAGADEASAFVFRASNVYGDGEIDSRRRARQGHRVRQDYKEKEETASGERNEGKYEPAQPSIP